jgi:hypothetical protein
MTTRKWFSSVAMAENDWHAAADEANPRSSREKKP